MATAAAEAEAVSQARQTPVLWSGRWSAVCHVPHFHSNFICNSQKLETIQMSLSQNVDTENVVHLHNGILFNSKKKKKMMNFAGKWMEPENIILSEVT